MNLKDFLEYMAIQTCEAEQAYPSQSTIETTQSLYNTLIENGHRVHVSWNGENELAICLRKNKKLFDFFIVNENISYGYGVSSELEKAVGEDYTTKSNIELLELVKNHFQDR